MQGLQFTVIADLLQDALFLPDMMIGCPKSEILCEAIVRLSARR